jgi:hypothetical protein
VPTLLADPPAAPSPEQPPAPESAGAPAAPESAEGAQRKCKKCGASMEPAQEWCLQCGTPVPGGLSRHAPSWRASAVVLGATAILAVGAATAAYAALTKSPAHHVIIAQVPAATTPVTPTTVAPSTTPTPTPPATTTTPAPALPTSTVKPPKIPLTAPTPKITTTPKSTPTTTTPKATTPKKTTTTPTSTEPLPTTTAILLDTNAVTTYNPENYPAETFGDPSLAADGDTSTGWTARVDPAIAPRMAVGLLIDLNTAQKLSTLELITSTPGMTVEVFGANGSTAPATITDPAWTHLSPYQVEKKTHMVIKLGDSTKAFRFVTLWISGAPAGSIGTAAAPGRVSVNEVELFPTK